ncbi:MAG: hypothetical protein CUN56_17200, partial [Phototrophicales bacterium]
MGGVRTLWETPFLTGVGTFCANILVLCSRYFGIVRTIYSIVLTDFNTPSTFFRSFFAVFCIYYM